MEVMDCRIENEFLKLRGDATGTMEKNRLLGLKFLEDK